MFGRRSLGQRGVREEGMEGKGFWSLFVGIGLCALLAIYGGARADLGDPLLEGGTAPLSGGIVHWGIFPSAVTPSGETCFGAHLSAVSAFETRGALNGVTVYVPSGTGNGESMLFYSESLTSEAGTTLWVVFWPKDDLVTDEVMDAGVSCFMVSGTTMDELVYVQSNAPSAWMVKTSGSPTIQWR